VKGVGEGNIIANIKYEGKVTRVCLTQVMHIPDAEGKILSLNVLDQRGFESHITGGRIHFMKADEIYTEGISGGELYEVKMKIVPSQEMATIKSQENRADEARRE